MPEAIYIRGMSDLIKGITKMSQLKQVKAAIRAAGMLVKSYVAEYPPANDGNRPGDYPARWYQRGYGQRYALKGGGMGGRRTSERLGSKWTTQATNGGWSVSVGNNTKYGPYVQSDADQAWFHAQRNWPTDKEAIIRNERRVVELVEGAITEAINEV